MWDAVHVNGVYSLWWGFVRLRRAIEFYRLCWGAVAAAACAFTAATHVGSPVMTTPCT